MICFCVLSKVSKDIARFGGFLIGIFSYNPFFNQTVDFQSRLGFCFLCNFFALGKDGI